MTRAVRSGVVRFVLAVAGMAPGATGAADVRDLGDQRELFVDRWLIAEMRGVSLRLHPPQPAGIALRLDQPWEGRYSTYATVLTAEGRHRLYYRGRPALPESRDPVAVDLDTKHQVTCYAESTDGIVWRRPRLGLFEVGGSRENNVVLAGTPACANFTPFVDARPGVATDQRFKAVGGVHAAGLELFASADGIHWRRVRRLAGIDGAFDSQNVVFWSAHERCYVMYFRTWSTGTAYQGRREISRATSPDLEAWSPPVRMSFSADPGEELYTQQTQPYFRAPQIYLAFPSRFLPDRRVLSDEEFDRSDIWPRSRTSGLSDGLFLTSRGGAVYDRTFAEAMVRPGPDRRNWSPRNTYSAHGLIETAPGELSLYYIRNYAQPTVHLERFVLRLDGFASLAAGRPGGEALTHPLVFAGGELELNCATSAGGSIRVAICDPDGNALPGYSAADCDPIIGDELARRVSWRGSRNLAALAARPVRLRFVMAEADVYSLRFAPRPERTAGLPPRFAPRRRADRPLPRHPGGCTQR